MDPVACFREFRSGVAQVRLVREAELVGGGSGFLVDGGLITNSHVLRGLPDAVAFIRFEEMRPDEGIRISVDGSVAAESSEAEKDYAFLRLNAPEFEGRYRFTLSAAPSVVVGKQVGFLGYPFAVPHLTCHMAYVSAIFEENAVTTYKLDGSINAGNSGGPLIDFDSGEVVGIVTRAYTGLIESSFRRLIGALQQNQRVLAQTPRGVRIAGIDPIEALQVSQANMEQIALDLHRSANVGIGYAFSSEHVWQAIAELERGA